MALIITRKNHEEVRIGDITIRIHIQGLNRVCLTIDAPRDIKIERPEIDVKETERRKVLKIIK